MREVRIPLGREPWHGGPFRIVHVGQSALLLARVGGSSPRVTPQLVAVTSAARGLVPGGICVPDRDDFAHVVRTIAGDRPSPLGEDPPVVHLDRWCADPPSVVRVDLRLPPTRLAPDAVELLARSVKAVPVAAAGTVMDPAPLRALAGPLARAALTADDTLVGELLLRLVGSGPGTTPTGDDVVVGVLATLAAVPDLPRVDGTSAARRVARLLPDLTHRTTGASRHDLLAAADGQFSEHVHALVRALTDPALVQPTVLKARTWGATSGIDHASGVLAAARTVLSISGRPADVLHLSHHLRRSA